MSRGTALILILVFLILTGTGVGYGFGQASTLLDCTSVHHRVNVVFR